MEKGIKSESKTEKEELLTPDIISGKLFDSFRGREDVQKWIENKDLGLVSQEFVATMKKTLDTVAMMQSPEAAKEVAKYIKDDMDFNTRIFGDPEKETTFKMGADNYLNETYLKPAEPENSAPAAPESSAQ